MSEKRVKPEDFVPERCETAGCSAPRGRCMNDYGGGWYECPRGPYRNARAKVERRKQDRRAPSPHGQDVEALVEHLERQLRWADEQGRGYVKANSEKVRAFLAALRSRPVEPEPVGWELSWVGPGAKAIMGFVKDPTPYEGDPDYSLRAMVYASPVAPREEKTP